MTTAHDAPASRRADRRQVLRRSMVLGAAVAVVISTAVGVRADSGTNGNLSATLQGTGQGLRILSAGAACVPAQSQPCSPSAALALSFSIDSNQKHRVLFASLPAYTVQDLTGSGQGWLVTVRASQFVCTAQGETGDSCTVRSDKLPQGSLFMEGPAVACAGPLCGEARASVLPGINLSTSSPTAIDGEGSVIVASEGAGNGMAAQYVFTPRVWSCLPGGNGHCSQIGSVAQSGGLGLLVPQDLAPGTYSSTLTETVVSGTPAATSGPSRSKKAGKQTQKATLMRMLRAGRMFFL